MPTDSLISEKDRVRQFWEAEPCGSRYLQKRRAASQEAGEEWNAEDFETHARTRYELEPHIPAFANFNSAQGKKVLEIGVGMGADYLQWLKAGAHATGVDISPASIERARKRCGFAGFSGIGLRVADAENLPFPDNSFDVVYSYGAMHHSPDTARCIQEARRVLKVGGEARIMVYHHPSLTGLMLWLRYGVW
ncbi:MAG: class I SAM-dependent methyltransferase, partial [Candidatus Sulfotelmatobacter sp.]